MDISSEVVSRVIARKKTSLITLHGIQNFLLVIYTVALIFFYAFSSPHNDISSQKILEVLFTLSTSKLTFPFFIATSIMPEDRAVRRVLSIISVLIGGVTCLFTVFLLLFLLINMAFTNTAFSPNNIGNDPSFCCAFFNSSYVTKCNQTTMLAKLIEDGFFDGTNIVPYCDSSLFLHTSSQLAYSSSFITFIIATTIVLILEIIILSIEVSIYNLTVETSEDGPKMREFTSSIGRLAGESTVKNISNLIGEAISKTANAVDSVHNIFHDIGRSNMKIKSQ